MRNPMCDYCGGPMGEPEDVSVGAHEACRAAEATWHLQHPSCDCTAFCYGEPGVTLGCKIIVIRKGE